QALAFCHLQTLEYSQAERLIVESLARDPANEANKKAACLIVKDKYQTASLILEWLDTSLQFALPENESQVSRIKGYVASLRVAYETLTIASHPAVVKKWLPSVLFLPAQLKAMLSESLAKEDKLRFTKGAAAILLTRLIATVTYALD